MKHEAHATGGILPPEPQSDRYIADTGSVVAHEYHRDLGRSAGLPFASREQIGTLALIADVALAGCVVLRDTKWPTMPKPASFVLSDPHYGGERIPRWAENARTSLGDQDICCAVRARARSRPRTQTAPKRTAGLLQIFKYPSL